MPPSWHVYFSELIKGKRKGALAAILKMFLLIPSLLFRSVIKLRNLIFDRGCLRLYYPPVPVVISIGNIVAGGTGKTPVTLMIAREFYLDAKLAILSRGYRSSAESLAVPVVLCNGRGPQHPACYCGDEPYLLAKHLPQSIVIVGRDRKKSALLASQAGAEIILMDDGMQHRRLARDLEIVVINGQDPFGKGFFLPRGFLRDELKSLQRAHLVIINHIENTDHFTSIFKAIRQYSQAPIIGTQMELEALHGEKPLPSDFLHNRKVALFCGIANPEQFQTTVKQLGAEIVATHALPDHLGFDLHALHQFVEQAAAQGAEFVVCTEKDFVKLPPVLELSLPLIWTEMRLKIVEGELEWKTILAKAKQYLSQRRRWQHSHDKEASNNK